MSDETDDLIARHRVVPVVVLDDAGRGVDLAESLVAGGLPVAEVTFRTAAAETVLARMAADTRLYVGAGTVVTTAQVDRAVDAGARFVVCPGFSHAVVRRALQRGIRVYPGVATATEIMTALDAGLNVVKLFPAHTLGGPAMLSALAAPFPGMRFVPTGGVTATSLPAYLHHPAVLAVGGSWMVAAALLRAGDFAEVTRLTADAVRIAGSVARHEGAVHG